ncbi:hypothetical protein [Nocardioides nanhaiensis]
MAEQTPPPEEQDPSERTDRPILTGLVALVGVGLVVGLVLGGGALAATRLLGLGGEEEAATAVATERDSLVLPEPEETEEPDGPLVTLRPDPQQSARPSQEPTEEEEEGITLSAGQTQVSPMGQIDLTGVYPGGEGAILQVQRFEGGRWGDFPVTASVSNETFSTYIQTGQTGVNRFRMLDTDSGDASNEVKVTVG